MKTINLISRSGSTIKMEHEAPRSQVKITVNYSYEDYTDTMIVNVDKANTFYKSKLADGFRRV